MKKMNNKGYMLVEILVVTVVVMIIFLAVYINYYPLVGEYEKRIVYNDVTTKYSLFQLKKVYNTYTNTKRYKIREDFQNTNTKYINLLTIDNGTTICKREYIEESNYTYCDALIDKLGINNLIVSQYNIESLKSSNIEEKLDEYIDYLPNYSSYVNDNIMYRMLTKANTGYATTKLDIDLLGMKVEYQDTDQMNVSFKPNETRLLTFTICNERDTPFYYQINDLSEDDFTITSFFSNEQYLIKNACQLVTLAFKYTGLTNVETISLNSLYSLTPSITSDNFAVEDGYSAITTNVTLTHNYSGSYQEFLVPKTGYYEIKTWGAQGGTASYSTWTYPGGKGGYVSGKVYLTQGEQLYVYVGGMGESISGTSTFTVLSNGNGYNGGGSGSSSSNNSAHSGGGGATDIRLVSGNWDNDASLNSRIMVAGGGGGSASHHTNGINYSGTGGDGGNLIGETAIYQPLYYYNYGVGGSQTEGGYSVAFKEEWDYTGTAGFGKSHIMTNSSATASGGGGYYGGGAGRHTSAGGGSSFISGYAGVAAIIEGSVTEPNRNHIDSNEIVHTNHYSGKYFIDTEMQSGINSGNGKSTIKYLGTTAPTRVNTELDGVRYVKNCTNRNSGNNGNHTVEIQAIKNGVNLAAGKTPTESHGYVQYSVTPYTNVTDGQIDNVTGETGFAYTSNSTGGEFCLVIDLVAEYDLDEIAVWHWWRGGRTYYENITSVKGTSGSTYTTVLNNQHRSTVDGNRVSAYQAKPTQRTLTLNLNGGTTTYPTSYSIIEGDSVVLKDPTRANYTFTGWTCAGTGCSVSGKVVSIGTANATLTAQWRANSSIVTLNNQSATTAGTTSVTAAYGNAMPAITKPTKTGYTFGGYYTQTGGGGTQYYTAAGASAKNWDITMDTTLYAKWTPNTYTVAYNCNGGTGSTASSSHTYGVAKALSNNGCSRIVTGTGGMIYLFQGWATSSGGAVVYSNQQSVSNLASTQGATATLYAKWGNLFTYTGTYELAGTESAWIIRMKSVGLKTITFAQATVVDAFVVGGGGAGGGSGDSCGRYSGGGGGGSGYTMTYNDISLAASVANNVYVGSGGTGVVGANGNPGEQSYFISASYSANGGAAGTRVVGNDSPGSGGAGGSGGGAGGYNGGPTYQQISGNGGTNGLRGTRRFQYNNPTVEQTTGGTAGAGSNVTSCEFGQGTAGATTCNSGVPMYGGGGSGGSGSRSGAACAINVGTRGLAGGGTGGICTTGGNATANTGGGGGGGGSENTSSTVSFAGGNGGSGIVVLRKS